MRMIGGALQLLIRGLPAANFPDQNVGPAFCRKISAVIRKNHRAVVYDTTEAAECSDLLFGVRVPDINGPPAGGGHEPAIGREHGGSKLKAIPVEGECLIALT